MTHPGNCTAWTREVIKTHGPPGTVAHQEPGHLSCSDLGRHKMHTQPTETEPELCLSVSCEDKGQQWPATGAGALGAADLSTAQAFLEEVTINPTIEPSEPTQDWGKQTLGGHKQDLVCTRTQEKGAMTPQNTDPDLPKSIQVSPAEAWVGRGLLQGCKH